MDGPSPSQPYILRVGGQDEMKMRNPLPAVAGDPWTRDVLDRVYESLLLTDPTGLPRAFIAKGIDANENGVFEPAIEYDVWWETAPTSPMSVTVYYDFNGVRWHDGTQVTAWDLLFSYHVNAMHPTLDDSLHVLFSAGPGTTYEQGDRQLGVGLVAKNWQGEGSMEGDPGLRVAVQFLLNEPFARLPEGTLRPMLLPMHLWSHTGGGRHPDFGCAVWIPTGEATARGIAPCGTTSASKWGLGIPSTDLVPGSSPYRYSGAETWVLADGDVIGHGPFRFGTWVPGVEVRLARNDDYYTGIDPNTNVVYDARLPTRIHPPFIDGIQFKVYRTTQLGVFALQNGEIDFYHWNVGAEFVPDLLKNPNIAVESNAEPGFFYLAYNLRREPWGYRGGNPADDVGWVFRQAVSHLIDKRAIVQNLLQNFGVIGHGVISPANTFWYNGNIPEPGYSPPEAIAILDSPEARAVGIGADPPGGCARDTPSGCRSLGVRGTQFFEILTPQADYDPVRASAGAMIADAMRQVGINAVSKPTAFGQILAQITVRDFDMYILGWRIGSTDPDYLFSFFDSSNGASGQNYPGFNNATFDTVIRASRAELDRNQRQQYIFQAQQILAEARPYDVLYYRTNIEGYRQDRFVNWTVVAGTIWNYWSLLGIHPPGTPALRLSLSAPSAVTSASTAPITASVRDDQGRSLVGAQVTLGVTSGNLRTNTSSGATVVGITDASGTLAATFEAPVVADTTPVVLSAWASAEGFTRSSRSAIILVMPAGSAFLAVRLELPLGDIVAAGSALPMNVEVGNQDGSTVPDAWVTIESSDPRLTPRPSSGTAAEVVQVSLEPDTSVPSETTVVIRVVATKAGHADGVGTQLVTVLPYEPVLHDITIDTSPTGLLVEVDGSTHTAPYTFSCLAGSTRSLSVPSPQIGGSTRWTFASWSDGGALSHNVTCSAPTTFTAAFGREFQVTVDTLPPGRTVEVDGVAAIAPFSFWCADGGSSTVSAPSPQGTGGTRDVFATWSDGGDRSHIVRCSAPGPYTATFLTEHELAISTSPEGLFLTVDGNQVVSNHTLWCAEGSSVLVGTASPQTLRSTQYRFSNWSDGGGQTHAIPCGGPGAITATFEAVIPPAGVGTPLVLGGVLLAVAIVSGLLLFWRRRRRAKPEETVEAGEREPPP